MDPELTVPTDGSPPPSTPVRPPTRVAACPWCGSRSFAPFLPAGKDRLDRCGSCGVAFRNPAPPSSEPPTGGTPSGGPPSRAEVRRQLTWGRYDVRRIVRHLGDQASERLLDIGCGIGGRLVAARDAGFDVEGVEPDPALAAHGAGSYDLTIHRGTLDDFSIPDESFSVILLFHVLPRWHDPAGELERIVRILRPGGVLIIETPALDSWSSRLFGADWVHLDPERHRFHFPRPALTRRLQNLGLEARPLGTHHARFGADSFRRSAFRPRPGSGPAVGAARAIGRAAVTFLSPVLAGIESSTGRGSVARILARKPFRLV